MCIENKLHLNLYINTYNKPTKTLYTTYNYNDNVSKPKGDIRNMLKGNVRVPNKMISYPYHINKLSDVHLKVKYSY